MLEVTNLSISFHRYHRGLQRSGFTPVSDISLQIDPGEIVAVVGASGSGKSLLAHALLGLLPGNAVTGGTIQFRGENLDGPKVKCLRGREIALIPQSVTYLNPLSRVGSQVYRAACLSGLERSMARTSTDQTFCRYGLQNGAKYLYPFQLSGGMVKRVMTAAATAGRAQLLIADEPTTGLDPKVATKTLKHLLQLAKEKKAVLLITHDLDAAVAVATRVVVVYAGKTVETTAASSFHNTEKLLHPYTKALWQALPQNGFVALDGEQPEVIDESGCVFAPRCPNACESCLSLAPQLQRVNGSLVRCPHVAC